MTAVGRGAPFRVLVVCRSNQFRSTIAEHLLQRRAQALGLDWAVQSAGTHAEAGRAMVSAAAAALAEHGVTPRPGWCSRRLTMQLVEQSDLILVAERIQRGTVVELMPRAISKTYLLAQFARMAAALSADSTRSGAQLLADVRAAQGTMQPVDPRSDDIPDPTGQPGRNLHECVDRLIQVVDMILPIKSGQAAKEGPPAEHATRLSADSPERAAPNGKPPMKPSSEPDPERDLATSDASVGSSTKTLPARARKRPRPRGRRG